LCELTSDLVQCFRWICLYACEN